MRVTFLRLTLFEKEEEKEVFELLCCHFAEKWSRALTRSSSLFFSSALPLSFCPGSILWLYVSPFIWAKVIPKARRTDWTVNGGSHNLILFLSNGAWDDAAVVHNCSTACTLTHCCRGDAKQREIYPSSKLNSKHIYRREFDPSGWGISTTSVMLDKKETQTKLCREFLNGDTIKLLKLWNWLNPPTPTNSWAKTYGKTKPGHISLAYMFALLTKTHTHTHTHTHPHTHRDMGR